MSIFNIAFTAPANPDGASPGLSVDDLWQGCVLLAQAPELFTSAVSCCEAEETSPGRMIRLLKFRDEKIPDLKQELVLVDKHKVSVLWTYQTTNYKLRPTKSTSSSAPH